MCVCVCVSVCAGNGAGLTQLTIGAGLRIATPPYATSADVAVRVTDCTFVGNVGQVRHGPFIHAT